MVKDKLENDINRYHNVKEKIVIKVGSSTLTNGTNRISRGKLEELAQQIETLQKDYHVVLVSSGAIATAKQFVKAEDWKDLVASKQAMAAIGQPKLMQFYYEVFSDFKLQIAQCLLTYRDFDSEISKTNTLNTIKELLKHDFVPIINENDTVAVEEIELGDNDKLSAKVATLINAKTLILVSDVDGVYDKNPHLHDDAKLIEEVNDLESIMQFIDERKDGIGTGGMTSKLEAVRICKASGVETIITKGTNPQFLIGALDRTLPSTIFR